MQCKELEAVLEQEGLAPLPAAARRHLGECKACQDFLADLSAIVAAAKELAPVADPPERIWISLRAQLEAEGVIKEAVELPQAAPAWAGWRNLGAWLRPRALATAGVGLVLVVTAVFLSRQTIPQVEKTPGISRQIAGSQTAPAKQAPVTQQTQVVANAPAAEKTRPAVPPDPQGDLRRTEGDLANIQLAGTSPGPGEVSLRQNLQTLNEFIAECEYHLKQYPDDELAREYLNAAYQQKAELLAVLIDSGRSEH